MVVLGQSCIIRVKIVVFGQSGFILAKMVVFGQKSPYLGKNGCIRDEWLYS